MNYKFLKENFEIYSSAINGVMEINALFVLPEKKDKLLEELTTKINHNKHLIFGKENIHIY